MTTNIISSHLLIMLIIFCRLSNPSCWELY